MRKLLWPGIGVALGLMLGLIFAAPQFLDLLDWAGQLLDWRPGRSDEVYTALHTPAILFHYLLCLLSYKLGLFAWGEMEAMRLWPYAVVLQWVLLGALVGFIVGFVRRRKAAG